MSVGVQQAWEEQPRQALSPEDSKRRLSMARRREAAAPFATIASTNDISEGFAVLVSFLSYSIDSLHRFMK